MSCWKKCLPEKLEHEVPCLFLDRDGVVIQNKDYLRYPEQVEMIPGVGACMRAAAEAGYLLIGVSNQSGLGRGMFSPADLAAVMERIDELLLAEQTGFDAFYYCPHAPEDHCECRKPAQGLFDEAGASCRWDRDRSWMIGDKPSDVAFGRMQGLGSVLVRTGYGVGSEEEVKARWSDDPRVLVADDLPQAFAAIRALDQEGPMR